MKTCIEPGCDGKHVARGYCRFHYDRKKRNDEFVNIQNQRQSNMTLQEVVEWCLQQTKPGGANGDCMNWLKSICTSGYPQIRFKGKMELVGRLILIHREGEKPGMDTCHSCDNKRCINPAHIRWDTKQSNMIDKSCRSLRNRSLKLTPNDIMLIRRMLSDGIAQRQIADRFAVKQQAISYIKTGKTWSHIPQPPA